MRDDQEYVQVELYLIADSDKAYCFVPSMELKDAEKKVWIPRSQIKNITKFAPQGPYRFCRMLIPEWLAREKNL